MQWQMVIKHTLITLKLCQLFCFAHLSKHLAAFKYEQNEYFVLKFLY